MNLLFWKKEKKHHNHPDGTKVRVSALLIATGNAARRVDARAKIAEGIVYLSGEKMTGDRDVRVLQGDVLRIGRDQYMLRQWHIEEARR